MATAHCTFARRYSSLQLTIMANHAPVAAIQCALALSLATSCKTLSATLLCMSTIDKMARTSYRLGCCDINVLCTIFAHCRAHTIGTHHLDVRIFNRPIRGSPLKIQIDEHHSPLMQIGSEGDAAHQLRQPTRVLPASCDGNSVFVLDTGNCRGENRSKIVIQHCFQCKPSHYMTVSLIAHLPKTNVSKDRRRLA